MMQQYLPNVIECSKDEAQVIIADNASTDDSLQMLSRDFPQLRTIVLDDNYGFAEGYNRALKQVDAEYYVLLNSDVEVTPHWLKPLLNYMDTNSDLFSIERNLNTQEQAAVSWTSWATLFAVGEFSTS